MIQNPVSPLDLKIRVQKSVEWFWNFHPWLSGSWFYGIDCMTRAKDPLQNICNPRWFPGSVLPPGTGQNMGNKVNGVRIMLKSNIYFCPHRDGGALKLSNQGGSGRAEEGPDPSQKLPRGSGCLGLSSDWMVVARIRIFLENLFHRYFPQPVSSPICPFCLHRCLWNSVLFLGECFAGIFSYLLFLSISFSQAFPSKMAFNFLLYFLLKE